MLRKQFWILATLFFVLAWAKAETADDNGRRPCCAGSWYPGDAEGLAKVVDGFLNEASPPKVDGKPLALIAPHAGYRFSGPVAAAGYRALDGHRYKRVIVMAFSHRYAGTYGGVDVPKDLTAYDTPLGPVPIDRQACDELLQSEKFSSHQDIDREEHSLELQLPFLQRAVGKFQLVPLLVGKMSLPDYAKVAEALLPLIDEETLLVASSDFTHFGPDYGYRPFREEVPTNLLKLADRALAPLEKVDFDGFAEVLEETKDTICGRGPILLLLRTLSMQGGATGLRAAVDTSGRMLGDWSNSVTYQSVVFVPRSGSLSHEERMGLLRLARETVTARLNGKESIPIDPSALPEKLRGDGASFVTLLNGGNLRGCIGNMVANGPLWKSVVRNSAAACEDYRFQRNPITKGELDDIEIEVSYLTPLKQIQPEEVVVGRDGLLIVWGRYQGVLLPQVAYERGWLRKEFLNQVCVKAGAPAGTWKRDDMKLFSFRAEVFSESHELHH